MANRRRGEVDVSVGGRTHRLCLTLGSLAELEDAFGVEDLTALSARFASGRLSSRDLVRLFGAGLRGAGQATSDDELRGWPIAGCLEDMAAAVAELLQVTFGEPAENPPLPQQA